MNTSQFQDSSRDKTLQLFCTRNPFNNNSRSALESITSSSQADKRQVSPKDHGLVPDLNLEQEVSAAELVNHTIWEVHLELKRDKGCSQVTHSLLNTRNPYSNSCHLTNSSHRYQLSRLLQGSQQKDFMASLKTTRLQRAGHLSSPLTNFWTIRVLQTECAQEIQVNLRTHSMIHLGDQVHSSQIMPKEAPQEQLNRIQTFRHITNREILTQTTRDLWTKSQFAFSRLNSMVSTLKRSKYSKEINQRKSSTDLASSSISVRALNRDYSCKSRTKSPQRIPSIDI